MKNPGDVCSDEEGARQQIDVCTGQQIRGEPLAAHFLPSVAAEAKIGIGKLFSGRATHQPRVLYNLLLFALPLLVGYNSL